MNKIILIILIIASLTSCVSKGKFNALTASHNQLDGELVKTRKELADAKRELTKFRDVTTESNVRKSETIQEKDQLIARLQQQDVLSTQKLADCQKKLNYCEGETLKKAQEAQNQLKVLQQEEQWKLAKINQLRVEIMTNLGDLFDTATVSLMEQDGQLILELGEKLLFPEGSKYIAAKGRSVLENIALVLAKHKDVEVNVVGHSVVNGDEKNNWKVSTRRATSVVFILTENEVAAEQVLLSGRGEYQPLVENKTSSQKAKNQRTEIILTPIRK